MKKLFAISFVSFFFVGGFFFLMLLPIAGSAQTVPYYCTGATYTDSACTTQFADWSGCVGSDQVGQCVQQSSSDTQTPAGGGLLIPFRKAAFCVQSANCSGATIPPATPVVGDVTQDRIVDIADSLFIAQYVNGSRTLTPDQLKGADVNSDGKVSTNDANIIAVYLVGLLPKLPATLRVGDVDQDGTVSIADSLFIAQYEAGNRTLTQIQLAIADVNNDSKVTKADADTIANYLVGLVSSLPFPAAPLASGSTTAPTVEVIPPAQTTGAEETISQTVSAGSSVSTDSEGDGTTASDPIETSVTAPTSGQVTIAERPTTAQAPPGFSFLAREVNITAPPATSANPLTISLQIHASLLPAGANPNAIRVFKDRVVVIGCPGDPCVSNIAQSGGNVVITVRTSSASAWNFGFAQASSAGLVPCGGEGQPACTLCHIFELINNIIKFFLVPSVFNPLPVVLVIATLLFAIGGFMLFASAGNAQNLSRARTIIFATVIGLLIIYGSWVFVGMLLDSLGVVTFGGVGNWWAVDCPVPVSPGCADGTVDWRFGSLPDGRLVRGCDGPETFSSINADSLCMSGWTMGDVATDIGFEGALGQTGNVIRWVRNSAATIDINNWTHAPTGSGSGVGTGPHAFGTICVGTP